MTYPDSVRFLYSLGNETRTAKLGLERIALLLEALGNPHGRMEFVHVAGTNGKGSVSAMIESGLRAAGVRTGLFTSPHLVEPTERIRIEGRQAEHGGFAGVFNRVHGVAEDLLARGALELHPSYFETLTAMALLSFQEAGVECAVLEVGLGGRLDATNVVTPRLAVITPVDFDHEALLGSSLEAIASEKAGILKPGIPAVFAGQRPEVARVLDRRAAEMRTRVIRSSDWRVQNVRLDRDGCRFRACGGQAMEIECPLAGEHQLENALTAAVTLDALGIPAKAVEEGIRKVCWPGRLQRISEDPEILVDGAHNPAGARALAAYIERFYSNRRVWLIYGAMRDKAVGEMGGILFPKAARLIATAPSQVRAVRPEAIRQMAGHSDVRTAARLSDALELFRSQAGPGDVAFISGSLFLVGEALEYVS